MKHINHIPNYVALFFATAMVMAACCIFPQNTAAQNVDEQTPGYHNWRIRLGSLSQMNDKEREKVLEDADTDYAQLLTSLLTQLYSPDNKVKCYAAYFLGRYRFEDAIKPLSDQITLEDKTIRLQRHLWYWSSYPAADALIRIGQRSIPEMFVNIETSNDPEVQKLSRDVVRIIADDPEIMRILFKREMDKQQDEKKKEKLQSALQALEAEQTK